VTVSVSEQKSAFKEHLINTPVADTQKLDKLGYQYGLEFKDKVYKGWLALVKIDR
jgi:hypothetical protein